MAFLAPARLFSLIFALLHVKSAILVAFYYAFKAHNPRRIWSHFSGISAFTKNTCYTPGYTEVTARTCWLSTPLSCTKIKSSKIERSIQFDCTIFVWVRFSSIAELNRTQSTDWVRLSSIEFDWRFDLLGREKSICCSLTPRLTGMESVYFKTTDKSGLNLGIFQRGYKNFWVED